MGAWRGGAGPGSQKSLSLGVAKFARFFSEKSLLTIKKGVIVRV